MRLSSETPDAVERPASSESSSDEQLPAQGGNALTYAGLFLFTILLYVRPNELYPETFGTLPIVKTLAICTVVVYLLTTAAKGQPITVWPIEVKMVLLLFVLGVLFVPFAARPQDSIDVLSDTYSKVVIIFVLMVNVVTTRGRLVWLLRVVVLCGTWLALSAVRDYQTGNVLGTVADVTRVRGIVGGIFGNANDLATALDVLLPLAVALALTSKGAHRLLYLACSVALGVGVVITFSRTGFLGLVVMGAVLIWKMGRENRAVTALAAVLVLGSFLAAAPGGYGDRLETITNIGSDATGSAQERRELMERAAIVALYHPIVGVGMGNFHIFSIREKVAHNAYLETAAELGLIGLVAYLVLIVAPFRSLLRLEREVADRRGAAAPDSEDADREREMYYLCIALQASLIAYMVCSFFGSIQYQWLLYYLVAHTVALRTIQAAYRVTNAEPGRVRVVAAGRGVLWKSYQRASGKLLPTSSLAAVSNERID